MIFFIVREENDVYIEARNLPVRVEDVEVDGKSIIGYTNTLAEAIRALTKVAV